MLVPMSPAASWLTKKRTRVLSLACACAWSLGLSSSCDGGGAAGGDAGGGPADSGAPPDAAAPDGDASTACSVQTAQGPVVGDASNDGCTFLGIPYAAPPKG